MTLITCKPGPESFYKVKAKIVDSLRSRRVIICHYHTNHSSELSYLFDNFSYYMASPVSGQDEPDRAL